MDFAIRFAAFVFFATLLGCGALTSDKATAEMDSGLDAPQGDGPAVPGDSSAGLDVAQPTDSGSGGGPDAKAESGGDGGVVVTGDGEPATGAMGRSRTR